MLATLFVNFLLLLVCLGFGASVWSSGQHWGPEGPVGAWLIPATSTNHDLQPDQHLL